MENGLLARLYASKGASPDALEPLCEEAAQALCLAASLLEECRAALSSEPASGETSANNEGLFRRIDALGLLIGEREERLTPWVPMPETPSYAVLEIMKGVHGQQASPSWYRNALRDYRRMIREGHVCMAGPESMLRGQP